MQLNLHVYSICYEEKQSLNRDLSPQSAILFSDTISLLQFDNHICWMKTIDKFLRRFRCRNCGKFWCRSLNFQRHIGSSSDRIGHSYPTGPFQLNETVFEKMRNLDIEVESYLLKTWLPSILSQSPCTINLLSIQTAQLSWGNMFLIAFPFIPT